jgi:hypothetical protein
MAPGLPNCQLDGDKSALDEEQGGLPNAGGLGSVKLERRARLRETAALSPLTSDDTKGWRADLLCIS